MADRQPGFTSRFALRVSRSVSSDERPLPRPPVLEQGAARPYGLLADVLRHDPELRMAAVHGVFDEVNLPRARIELELAEINAVAVQDVAAGIHVESEERAGTGGADQAAVD